MIGPDNSYNAAITTIVGEILKPRKDSHLIISGSRKQLLYIVGRNWNPRTNHGEYHRYHRGHNE